MAGIMISDLIASSLQQDRLAIDPTALANSVTPGSSLRCSSLMIPQPNLPGVSIDFLNANVVPDATAYIPESVYTNHGPVNVTGVSFCVVSIGLTHDSQSDLVNTQVWLPLNDDWNGRLMGIGGGGLYCGLYPANMLAMLAAVGEGYAAVSTDCGHTALQSLEDWLLESPGHVNEHLLDDFASVSLNDAAVIGKSVIESFYGERPKHSYFSGCSQGGRQGMALAQKYPDAYDGIAAASPAIYLAKILVAGFYTQFVLNKLTSHPKRCELDYLTNMAIRQCDELDGIRDNIVTDIDACQFDAFKLVDSPVPCGEQTLPLSRAAAVVATAAWQGASSGVFGVSLWDGVDVVANLTDDFSSQCTSDGKCTGLPVAYSSDWIRLAVMKDPNFDLDSITQHKYNQIFYESAKEYQSIIGTSDPDLSKFSRRGGKILTFHGLADQMIPSRGTRHYYESTAKRDPYVRDFYRLFEAPGLGHCWSPTGLYPSTIFDDLVAWVEEGRIPHSLSVSFTDADNVRYERILCPYPEGAIYDGHGDPTARSSYYCSVDGINFQSNVYVKPTGV